MEFWHDSNGLTQLLMFSKHFSQMNSFVLTILQGWGERVILPVFWMKELKEGF